MVRNNRAADPALTLHAAIKLLDERAPRPSESLPEELFQFISRKTPLVNVDLLITNQNGHTLLTWRDDGTYPPGWHVPGGIVRYQETLQARVTAVARLELGATVACAATPLAIHEIFDRNRDIRGHFISFLYGCSLQTPPDDSLRHVAGTPKHRHWQWHASCPDDLLAVHEVYRSFLSGGETAASCPEAEARRFGRQYESRKIFGASP